MNACGCKSCGGSVARANALLARRVVAHAPFIVARLHATPAQLANRTAPYDLYSRLVMRAAAREG